MAKDDTPTETIDTPEVDTPEVTDTPVTVAAAPKRKKAKRSVSTGQAHILATFNNTIITFTDPHGAVLTASSAGACGFRGSKKGTAYAAQVATEKAGQLAKQSYGLGKVEVYIKGIGLGRDAAIRTLSSLDLQIEVLKDITGVPHGGVRPRKARRV
jgi:small subunit ribosomal protein S11